jgi:hypothetical protein
MEKLWFGTAAGSFSLFGWLISSDATKSATGHYSFWGSPLAVGAYSTAAIGVTALICGLVSVLSSPRRRTVLGDDHLRDIWRISTEPGYTWTQKGLLLKGYLGMRMQVSGTLVEAGEWTESPSRATITTHVCNLTVHMIFSRKGKRDYPLSILTVGTPVTAVGKIKRIGSNGILLVKCEPRRQA